MPQEPDNTIDYGRVADAYSGTSGFRNLDSLLYTRKWADPALTYSFPDDFEDDYSQFYPVNSTDLIPFTSAQKDAAVYWLDQYASISGLSFVELNGAVGALDEDQEATLRFARDFGVSQTAFAFYPSNNTDYGGDMWYSNVSGNPVLGDYSHMVFGHELAHALGLKHAHETYPNGAAHPAFDSLEYTITTYRSYPGHDLVQYPYYTSYEYPQSLMAFDIAAIQFLYGANFATQAGDTTYAFDPNSGSMTVDGVDGVRTSVNTIMRTIWDGDGLDTYDFSKYRTDLAIDLTPGGYSDLDVGGVAQRVDLGIGGPGFGVEYARGNVWNAYQHQNDARSLIENAIGGFGADQMTGNLADNFLDGRNGDDTLSGGAGDDTLHGGYQNDNLMGGVGNDRLLGQFGRDLLDGGNGNDSLYGGNAQDTLTGGNGNDRLLGQGGSDELSGGSGNDYLDGGASADVLSGGNGKDVLKGGAFNDMLDGGTGDDRLDGGTGRDTLDGGAGNDVLVGGSSNDTLSGDAGDDTLDGGIGRDVVSGDAGDDMLIGGNANDTLDGGAGADTVSGGTGSDWIIVNAGEGGDVLFGGAGTDRFDFESGFGMSTIEDFQFGRDRVDLKDVSTVSNFSSLGISYDASGASATVDVGGGDLLVFNNLALQLGAGDFLI